MKLSIGSSARTCSMAALALLLVPAAGSADLKSGTSLTPTVEVVRRGRLLVMDCELRNGAGGEYPHADRSNPPQFTIYKDGREIGSGSFEYG